MPRLSNVTLKAMALTGNPANRRPIHAMKSATKENPMPNGHTASGTVEELQEPSAEVLKALSEVSLAKSAGDADSEAAAEAVGRLLAVHKGLTLEDVLAVAKAAGVQGGEQVQKAGKPWEDGDDGDDEEENDADTDSGDDSEDDDAKAANGQTKGGKFKKGNPWAKKMKKSADLDPVFKSAPSEVAKAVHAMRDSYEARIAKAERIISEERDHRMTNLIKSEMQASFKNLGVDHDKLTSIVKHARESGNPAHAAHLMQVLKAADAQVALANKSGGNAFGAVGKSTRFGDGNSPLAQIYAHADAMIQKGEVKKTRSQLVDEFLQTPKGMELWAEHVQEGAN